MNVQTIMTKTVQCCGPDSTLESIAETMWNSDCGSVPVVDDAGIPVGMITDRDLAMSAALNHKPLWELTARDVLGARPVYTCRLNDDVTSALKTMSSQHIRRIPVVDDSGHLKGILSIGDIVERAERGSRGGVRPQLSFDDAMTTLKSVSHYH